MPRSALRENCVETRPPVSLSCGLWRPPRGGFVYENPSGAEDGVRKIVYSPKRLLVRVEGGSYQHIAGPVGYAQMWLRIGPARLLARFHDFRTNSATSIVARRPSRAAADGEAAFWDVLWGDDASEARQQAALALLRKSARRDRRDGRSRFLLGMTHL